MTDKPLVPEDLPERILDELIEANLTRPDLHFLLIVANRGEPLQTIGNIDRDQQFSMVNQLNTIMAIELGHISIESVAVEMAPPKEEMN